MCAEAEDSWRKISHAQVMNGGARHELVYRLQGLEWRSFEEYVQRMEKRAKLELWMRSDEAIGDILSRPCYNSGYRWLKV